VPEAWDGPDWLRAWAMEWVPGLPLAAFQVTGAPPEPFAAAGRALAAFHAAPLDPGRRWEMADEAQVLARALDAVAKRHGDAGAPGLSCLRYRTMRALEAPEPMPPVLLHRDFYPDQALVDGERLWLLDLDLAATGDRHVDLGNFLAHLTEFSLRRYGRPDALAPQGDALLRGYAEGGGAFDGARTAALHDVSLARHLDICARFEDRQHVFGALLAQLTGAPAITFAAARG
jgi:aminoglycoside phosphotransferase (APT) family kinase protein